MMPARLEIVHHTVSEIRLSDRCRFEDGVLQIEPRQIESLVAHDIRLQEVVIARPGESMRIAPVLDVVEPRAREGEAESAYPGFFEKSALSEARGRTHVLEGAAVIAVAKLPGAQEGLIDMQRAAIPFCPFAQTINVVLHFALPDAMPRSEADTAIRLSTLKVAEFLGRLAVGLAGKTDRYPAMAAAR